MHREIYDCWIEMCQEDTKKKKKKKEVTQSNRERKNI